MDPRERHLRKPLDIMLGFGFGKVGEPSKIKYTPDRSPFEQAADQGYDLRPLSQDELRENGLRLIRQYHTLFQEMPESRRGYATSWDSSRIGERSFRFVKNGITYRVGHGINEYKIPYLTITDETTLVENDQAREMGVPSEELLDIDDIEEVQANMVLAINDDHSDKYSIICENWFNQGESLISAEGLLLEKFEPPLTHNSTA